MYGFPVDTGAEALQNAEHGIYFERQQMLRSPALRLPDSGGPVMARYRCIRVHLAAVVCCFLLTAMPSHGQAAGTGAISGIVSDPSGAVVPGADVTAQNLATGEMRHTASSAKGDYSFQLLSPGRYQVVIAKAEGGKE